MKRIISVFMCIILLCACVGCSEKKEEEPEPLYVSDEIRIVTRDLTSVEELTDKILAVQESFDKEYSDFVIEHWLKKASNWEKKISDGLPLMPR